MNQEYYALWEKNGCQEDVDGVAIIDINEYKKEYGYGKGKNDFRTRLAKDAISAKPNKQVTKTIQ